MSIILVVDDDELFRHYLTTLLKRAGYGVITWPNGLEAAVIIETGGFDAVVTDLHMPEVGGIEVICAVKRQHPAMPVIGVTGGAPIVRDPSSRTMPALGADAILTKPIYPVPFLAILRHVLNHAAPEAAGDPTADGRSRRETRT